MCEINCSGGCPECSPEDHKRKPHVHAELIKAWADGAQIEEWHVSAQKWVPIGLNDHTILWCSHSKYRIKPEPKPDRKIRLVNVEGATHQLIPYTETEDIYTNYSCIEVIVDGETNKLKDVRILRK